MILIFFLVDFGRGVFIKDMAGHSHSKNSYELHFIVDGEGKLTTDTKAYNISKGDFFVTGPNIFLFLQRLLEKYYGMSF